jgi:hypothetical protein
MEVDAAAHPGDEFEKALSRSLSSAAAALRESGCDLIGHIKLFWTGEGEDYLMLNLTSFDETPSVKGELQENAGMGRLTVHAVAYGTEGRMLEEILRSSLLNHLSSHQ